MLSISHDSILFPRYLILFEFHVITFTFPVPVLDPLASYSHFTSLNVRMMIKIFWSLFLLVTSTICDESCGGGTEDLRAIENLIDLERYPIHRPGTQYDDLIAFCQDQLKKVGSVDLPGFIRSSVLEKMSAEVDNLPSYNRLNIVSAYGAALDDEPEEMNRTMPDWNGQAHPAKRKFSQDVFAVAGDQIPRKALIRRIYESEIFSNFLARASGKEKMYQMDDEFQNINIMYMYDGCSRAWHYDGTDTVITILLQKPELGGEYEFAPFIRGKKRGEENFEDVARLFDGSYHNNIVKNAESGTLNLFNGVRSLHRVRTVYGPKKRIISILSYHTQPNLRGSISKNVKLYGERVASIYKERGLL